MGEEAVSVVVDLPEGGEMHTLAYNFLSRTEQEKVTQAVQRAERVTSGEIVPMIVSRSHDYPMAAVSCGVSFALPLAILLTHIIGPRLWIGSQNLWFFLGLFSTLYLVCYHFVMRTERLKYFFLSERQVEQEVKEAALAAFYEEKLYKTEQQNGILLYISVLEQKVWILADSNIIYKIDQQEWDVLVEHLTDGIKKGERCEAICRTVQSIGQILKTHFPYQEDDRDELHNLIIR